MLYTLPCNTNWTSWALPSFLSAASDLQVDVKKRASTTARVRVVLVSGTVESPPPTEVEKERRGSIAGGDELGAPSASTCTLG
jgi:hypothetical protein